MSGADAGAPTRRMKHRREVKRYHQRQQNRAVRAAAASRDDILFLFHEGRELTGTDGAPPPPERAMVRLNGGAKHETAGGTEPVWAAGPSALAYVNPTTTAEGRAVAGESPERAVAAPTYGDLLGCDLGSDSLSEFDFRPPPRPRHVGVDYDLADDMLCSHTNAIVPSSFYAELSGRSDRNDAQDGEAEGQHETSGGAVASSSLVMVPPRAKAGPPPGPTPLSVLPLTRELGGVGAAKVLNSIHVQRVEGVPPLPAAGPLAAGTDLSVPTSGYLMMDPMYNIHQHAPGFTRNSKVAMRSLLANAVLSWKDLGGKTTVLSTGDAMRSVFQQAYTDDKRLALHIQRIGPTVVIGTQHEPPTTVREMRSKALLGKALYRIHDTHDAAAAAQQQQQHQQPSESSSTAVMKEVGTLALPNKRVGGVVSTSKVTNRFSQTLRWSIDDLKVLVGVDTPIVLDRRSNSEQMLKLEDVSQRMTQEELQRDALNCWFDATLANVPQVGIYIHNEGVVQSFEVKKVQELLGLVEGRMATAAMNFTSNVLQWLVSQCVRDNGSYAVVRDYENDCLALYELPESGNALADLMDDGVGAEASGTAGTAASPFHRQQQQQKQSEYNTMRFNLACMCFQMGRHLYNEGAPDKHAEATRLLLRSFVIFLREPNADGSTEYVAEITSMLPSLTSRLLARRHNASGNAEPITPEVLRKGLLACIRFEDQLHHALETAPTDAAVYLRYVRNLLPCSAALCVVAAAATDSLRVTGPLAGASPAVRETARVLVEALVRLEHLRHAVRGYVRSWQQLQHPHPHQGPGGGSDRRTARRAGRPSKQERSALATEETGAQLAVTAATSGCAASRHGTEGAGQVVDPSTDVDLVGLDGSLAEVFGDVVRLALADTSGIALRALNDASRGVADRAEAEGPFALSATTTTLEWLRELPSEAVSLSLTALRLYSRAVGGSCRVLRKTAHVQVLVSHSEARRGHFPKALELLYRARAVARAADTADDADAAFAECFCAAPPISTSAVQRALGDVYARMADLKAEVSAASADSRATDTDAQPLCVGPAHALTSEEEDFLSRAVVAYREGGWVAQQAVMLLRGVSAVIEGLALAGEPFTAAVSAEIYDALRSAEALGGDRSRNHQLQREWAVLRLYTCTAVGAVGAALAKQAAEVARAWGQRLSGSLVLVSADAGSGGGALGGSGAGEAHDPGVPREKGFCVGLAEQHLQLALYHAAAAEAEAESTASADALQRHRRAAVAALGSALGAMEAEEALVRAAVLARLWAPCTASEWAPRMAIRIALRLVRSTPPSRQDEATRASATLSAWMLVGVDEVTRESLESALQPIV